MYVDLLVALTLISLTAMGLFTGARQLKQSRIIAEQHYSEALTSYERVLLKPYELESDE